MWFLMLLFGASCCFGGAIYQDSLLTLGNYSVSQFHSSGVTESISQTAIGNPSNGLLVTDVVAPGPLTSDYAFINPLFAYDPAVMGSLASVGTSLDVRIDVLLGQVFSSGWDLWIKQGPNFYYHEFGAPGVEGVFRQLA